MDQIVERKEAAQKIIRRHLLFSAGLGFIPFPVVDAAAIMGNQVLMIHDLSDLYEVPFKKHLVKSFIGSLMSTIGVVGVVKIIPGLGSILGGATVSASATAATYALGKIFTQHFAQGGTLLDFDPVKSRKHFQQLHEEGKLKEMFSTEEGKETAIVNSIESQSLNTKELLEKPRIAVTERSIEEEVHKNDKNISLASTFAKFGTLFRKKNTVNTKQNHRLLSYLKLPLLIAAFASISWFVWNNFIQDKDVKIPDINEAVISIKESVALPAIVDSNKGSIALPAILDVDSITTFVGKQLDNAPTAKDLMDKIIPEDSTITSVVKEVIGTTGNSNKK